LKHLKEQLQQHLSGLMNEDDISQLVSMQRNIILNTCCNIGWNMFSVAFSCWMAEHCFTIWFNNLIN